MAQERPLIRVGNRWVPGPPVVQNPNLRSLLTPEADVTVGPETSQVNVSALQPQSAPPESPGFIETVSRGVSALKDWVDQEGLFGIARTVARAVPAAVEYELGRRDRMVDAAGRGARAVGQFAGDVVDELGEMSVPRAVNALEAFNSGIAESFGETPPQRIFPGESNSALGKLAGGIGFGVGMVADPSPAGEVRFATNATKRAIPEVFELAKQIFLKNGGGTAKDAGWARMMTAIRQSYKDLKLPIPEELAGIKRIDQARKADVAHIDSVVTRLINEANTPADAAMDVARGVKLTPIETLQQLRQRVGEERVDQLLFDWDGAFVDQDGLLRKTLSDRFGTSGREATPRVAPKHFLEWLQSPAADEMATTIAPAERADYLARVADARQALRGEVPSAQAVGRSTPEVLQAVFTPKEFARYNKVSAELPEFATFAAYLDPSEVKIAMRNPDAFVQLRSQLPSADLMAGPILAGAMKRGWYRESRRAIEHVFQEDADLFAGVLAATSPQNSVEMNLINATRIYAAWVKAGRPTERSAILKIMGESVLGTKGEKSVLDAWKNNTVRVLQEGRAISGPKVDSFWTNLRSRPRSIQGLETQTEDAVTIDAWMGHLFGARATNFAGTQTKAKTLKGDPGFSQGYLAGTSVMREAAQNLGLTPEETQEMSWSFGKALYELAEREGMSAVDALKSGRLTSDLIAETPDFSRLLLTDESAALKGLSSQMDERLASLPPSAPRTSMPMNANQEASAMAAAERLDRLARTRGVDARSYAGVNAPNTAMAYVPIEGVSGANSGVYRESLQRNVSQGVRDKRASAMLDTSENILGRNVMVSSAFPDAAGTQARGVGVYKPEKGPMQRNKVGVSQAEVRLDENGAIVPEDKRALAQAHLAQSVVMGQDVAALSIARFKPEPGKISGIRFITPKAFSRQQVETLSKQLDPDVFAIQHDTNGFNVVKYAGGPMSAAEQQDIADLVARRVTGKKNKRTIVKNRKEFENLAGDIGYVPIPWGELGSRQVTSMLEAGNAGISPLRLASMDAGAKAQAAATLRLLERSKTPQREDHLNLLRIMAKSGLTGLRAALDDPAQLLPVLAAIGVSPSFVSALRQSRDRDDGGVRP